MASRFETVVALLRDEFNAMRVEDGRFELDALQWPIGRLKAKQHKEPPYVAWVRGGGSVRATAGINPIVDGESWLTPLYEADSLVLAVICGRGDEETEQLHYDVLRAAHRMFHAGSQPGSFRWVTQEDEVAAWAHGDAELVIQDFQWPFIVPKETKATVEIDGVTQDCEIVAAGGRVWLALEGQIVALDGNALYVGGEHRDPVMNN